MEIAIFVVMVAVFVVIKLAGNGTDYYVRKHEMQKRKREMERR